MGRRLLLSRHSKSWVDGDFGCGAWNGIESEGAEVDKEMVEEARTENSDERKIVPRAQEHTKEPESHEAAAGHQGATGRQGEDEDGLTKRVTHCTGNSTPLESLE